MSVTWKIFFADAVALATLGTGLIISELSPDPDPDEIAPPDPAPEARENSGGGSGGGGPRAPDQRPRREDPCKGLRDQLADHQQRLENYMRDPYAYDNKGILGKGHDAEIISGRINTLQGQIKTFVRDLPRLSVDIGLAYVPISGRAQSLSAIHAAMNRIGASIAARLPPRSC